MSMAPVINHVSPILPAKDIPGTIRWYEEKLGFRKAFVHPESNPDYGAVTRDSVEIHFFPSDRDPKKSDFMIYLRVAGIEALYAHCQEHGIVHPNGHLASKPWGQLEFAVIDPNGTVGGKNVANRGNTSLRGRAALVTGATRGMGLAIARALASEGAKVFITARDPKALAKVERELGKVTEAAGAPCDVRLPESVGQLAAAVKARFGKLDILINNAGITQANVPVAQLTYETWRDLIDTNLNSLFLITHAMLPLIRSGGAIVNTLSIAARQGFAGMSAYCASKYGALGFTETLREEVRGQGIRVIALIPGATDTELWNTLWPEAPREKMMSPETIARAVVDALKLPEDAVMEELVLRPRAGTL
jgi:NAD(P)-dependent dehydrogenase (short-subunit alcohol dehydrogenase family)/uncharacterized glyoxalase superfamily protein PhnB